MITRLLGAALLALLLVTAIATALPGTAAAVEDAAATGGEEVPVEGEAAHELPDISEIGTDVARSEGFFPEEYASPQWFQWVLYPLIVVGVVMVLGLLLYYLFHQPTFAEEREKSARS